MIEGAPHAPQRGPEKARVYERLMESMITNKLILKGAHTPDTEPFREQALEGEGISLMGEHPPL